MLKNKINQKFHEETVYPDKCITALIRAALTQKCLSRNFRTEKRAQVCLFPQPEWNKVNAGKIGYQLDYLITQ